MSYDLLIESSPFHQHTGLSTTMTGKELSLVSQVLFFGDSAAIARIVVKGKTCS